MVSAFTIEPRSLSIEDDILPSLMSAGLEGCQRMSIYARQERDKGRLEEG